MSASLQDTGRILFLVLAALAVVVTLVAIRLGRWPLWVVGYGLVLAALAVSVFMQEAG